MKKQKKEDKKNGTYDPANYGESSPCQEDPDSKACKKHMKKMKKEGDSGEEGGNPWMETDPEGSKKKKNKKKNRTEELAEE